MEVKIYKQKVKHLLYEQENHLAGLKAENMVSISYLDTYTYIIMPTTFWSNSS